MQSPLLKVNHIACIGGYTPPPVAAETKTPLANLTNSSCSRDWHLSSGDKSENDKPARRFKRLCKVIDHGKKRNSENMKENTVVPVVNLARCFSGTSPLQNKYGRGNLIIWVLLFVVCSFVLLFICLFVTGIYV